MRLFRELLTESLMMAVPGGVTGVLIARWSSAFLASRVLNVTPEAIPPAFALDGRVLLFALVHALAPRCCSVSRRLFAQHGSS